MTGFCEHRYNSIDSLFYLFGLFTNPMLEKIVSLTKHMCNVLCVISTSVKHTLITIQCTIKCKVNKNVCFKFFSTFIVRETKSKFHILTNTISSYVLISISQLLFCILYFSFVTKLFLYLPIFYT